jgi:hypothetical protein
VDPRLSICCCVVSRTAQSVWRSPLVCRSFSNQTFRCWENYVYVRTKFEPDRAFLSKHRPSERREGEAAIYYPIYLAFSRQLTDLIRPLRPGKDSPPSHSHLATSSFLAPNFLFSLPLRRGRIFSICFPHFRRILFDFEVGFLLHREKGHVQPPRTAHVNCARRGALRHG